MHPLSLLLATNVQCIRQALTPCNSYYNILESGPAVTAHLHIQCRAGIQNKEYLTKRRLND